MKNALMFLILFVVCSCGKSKDPQPEYDIYRKWKSFHEFIANTHYKNGKIIKGDSINLSPNDIWEFRKDGTMTIVYNSGTQTNTRYVIKGDSLIIMANNDMFDSNTGYLKSFIPTRGVFNLKYKFVQIYNVNTLYDSSITRHTIDFTNP